MLAIFFFEIHLIFFNETFGGNGRTCGTCHPAGNNFTIDPTFIATLSNNNPLFVAEFIDALNFDKNGGLRFENPVLMRQSGLIVENLDGFGDLANKFVMRGVPHVFAQSASITPATFFMDGSTVPPSQRTGWGGDGAPGGGTLRDFATGAVTQHFPLTLNRTPGVDFRLPTDAELDALEAFQLAQGRQAELDLFALPLTDSDEIAGRILFNGTGKCNQCHLNAGATLDGTQNVNFDTGVEEFLQNQLTVGGEPRPRDGGFGTVSNPDGSFGNGTFNTPSIAEAAGTGPFFHNNAVVTLEDAVDFYNSSEFNNSPGGQVVSGISLTNQEVQQIAAFLLAINAANVSGGNHNTGQGFTPASSNNAFFRFQLNNFASTADFNSLNFAITGSYQSTDIVNFKLWSSTDNTFESASDTLLATDTTISGNGETVNFTAFSNTVSQTTTHYFVTVDLAATASGADNIAGAITASGDIGFASGTSVSGTFPISGSDHSLPVELSAFSGTITSRGGIAQMADRIRNQQLRISRLP